MNNAWLGMLAVFSGLSMNLIVQFGLAMKEITLAGDPGRHDITGIANKKDIVAGLGIFFITVTLLWLGFSFIRSVLPLGLLEYVLLFPASFLVFSALEYLVYCFVIQRDLNRNRALTGSALCGTALFIMLNIAGSLIEAAVLSLGFTMGIVLALAIVNEIRRRSGMEAVPRFLRGGPLALIAMGLLSLVFSSAALMFYEVLGAM